MIEASAVDPIALSAAPRRVNIASRLSVTAQAMPDAVAAAETHRSPGDRSAYRTVTFAELERDSSQIAAGLREIGVERGTRLALLVRPSIDFIALTFGLFRAGAVIVLVDPGMGRRHLVSCLEAVKVEGFVTIPLVHAIRAVLRRRFAAARFNVCVGPAVPWGGIPLDTLRERGRGGIAPADTAADDPAAIIFTSGSTGPPKGVIYSHGNFDRQVDEIRDEYGIEPGGIDLPGFPLFGLFNAAMGTTTVVPQMDASRPARVDPKKFADAIHAWNVTQSFGSPAIWRRVGDYCAAREIRLPTLRRVMSAGAPVPPDVLATMKGVIAPDGLVHTPYGATEALPIATIEAAEVLDETAARTQQGAGTCVGRRFGGIRWKVIAEEVEPDCTPRPLRTLDDARELPSGQIGELIVSGAVVTRAYTTRTEWNERTKIADGDRFWHRMGDVGYLDDQDRFWYCGRMSHRVVTAGGVMYTDPCEGIFNGHPEVFRSALVGVRSGDGGSLCRPVIVCELYRRDRASPRTDLDRLRQKLHELALQHPTTRSIETFLFHPKFPVDVRHNAKIGRERLAVWAAGKLGRG